MNLSDYLKNCGHGAVTLLAVQIDSHAPDISNWSKGKRPVPISRCIAIERATEGAVTRRDLRPDDWHMIWPELANQNNRERP
ncbi:MAG: hypothetical protein GJU77_04315 [Ferrovum sp.]|jgi:DNA-binding transcriptional regulator YdaS (Cro superfamily)|nr:hypothetical protein [Ferrovum sp.]